MDGIRPENYEAPPSICKRLEANGDYLFIRGLKKEFGNFKAVRNLNVKMYDSQIFCLLGHNGAGKSTTISMISGLIGRTSGTAKVYDKDIFEETEEVREFLGVCPQYDVLFDLLTPREHLEVFYDFKGGDIAHKEEEINSLIESSGLTID
jgi:ATP-binding cassette subfamily A (ABC1) protein 3